MTDELGESDIEELADKIQDGPWVVKDYNYTGGRFEAPTVTIEAEWDPLSDVDVSIGTAKSLIEDLEGEEYGTPIDVVKEELEQKGVTDDPERALEVLRAKGDVYEPKTGYIRVV
jgi:hypothetical protein